MTDELLLSHTKPGRYIGNEVNMVVKSDAKIRFAFCFPDVYEIGMSHLGLQILYFFLNRREDTYCERVFMPWLDMADTLRENDIPLFALETGDTVKDFSFVGFTLQSETSYTNVLAMLELAKIPLYAKDRGEDSPIICAGGPCAVNPEPMADFIDFFYIGDGEAVLDTILDLYPLAKTQDPEGFNREAFLLAISTLPGVYVPRFYDAVYEEGVLIEFKPNRDEVPEKIKAARVGDLDKTFFPEKMLVPLIETVHNRTVVELFRGCGRGCRFCQAGFISRPVRERTLETLLAQAKALLASTGHEEISLVSLSTSDYSCFLPLLDELLLLTEAENINISLPSLRVDAVNIAAMEKTQKVRKSSLTLAPEAGTQRLRNVINKNLSDADIVEGLGAAFGAGYDRVKLYFMAGLPTEEPADLEGIAALCGAVVDEYYRLPKERRRRPVNVQVSCSCFVPKPFTPFQWARQVTADEFLQGQRYVKSLFDKKSKITYRYHDANTALVEGALARGGRPMGQVIFDAYKAGAVFDSWTEHFNFRAWEKAFGNCESDFLREREESELLPWDFIDVGVTKEFLLRERKNSREEKGTPDCLTGCAGCGANCEKPDETALYKKNFQPVTPDGRKRKNEPVTDCNRLERFRPCPSNQLKNAPSPHRFLLRFAKQNKMKFIGHLDLLKIFQSAIRRAGLDIAYSTGFNPHQKLTFTLPLPLGVESVCEYAEIVLNSNAAPERLADALNRQFPAGLEILEIYPLTEAHPKAASIVAAADYFLPGKDFCNANIIEEILSLSEIIVTKRSKSGEKEVNIRPDILELCCEASGLYMRLSAGSVRNLQPALAAQVILGKMGIESTHPTIIRTGLLDAQGRFLHEVAPQSG